MLRQILLASSNPGKIREIKQLLTCSNLKLLLPKDILKRPIVVAENGQTFKQNAWLKALAYAQASKLPTIAEDSGLQVRVLAGRPGVKSARYCEGTDSDRCRKLLEKLRGVNDRQAQFVTVSCFFNPKTKQSVYFTGRLTGQIALKPAGQAGFGYDSIFIPENYKNTLAELGLAIKNQIPARSQSIKQLSQYFAKNL